MYTAMYAAPSQQRPKGARGCVHMRLRRAGASTPPQPHPTDYRIRVAHSCTLAIRCRNCPAVASALGGPPHTLRSSV